MCLYKPWKSKTLAFFDDKRSKSGPRNFFKDFGCIILFKTLTGLIRAINRTNSWLNQTCRGDKRCQWRKEDHDSSRDPLQKKNAQALIEIFQIDQNLTFNAFHILNWVCISKIEKIFDGTDPPQKKGLFFWGVYGLKGKGFRVCLGPRGPDS